MAHRTVITSTNFLDTETLERKVNQTIVIEGTSISWVGPHSEYSQNEGDTIIDGTGKFVIPGLFDLHVHLNYRFTDFQNMGDLFTRRKESYADLIAVKHAQSYLTKGVTTVRGVGGRKSLASLRQLIDEGLYIGPRLRLALNTIAQPGNQEYFGPEALIHDRKNNEPVSGVDGILHAVRQRKADGANHIKTMTTGGVLHGKTSDVNLSLWNDEELRAMVVEAERLGMYVCAHAHNNNGIKAAVKAGVRSIEHSTMLDEDTIDLMVQMGTYITPTLSAGTFIKFATDEQRAKLPPEVINKWNHVSQEMARSHALAFKKGVPLTLGTDAPVAKDHCHTDFEMQLMVDELGLTPYEVIQAGTLISARCMRLDNELGSIKAGNLADLIVLAKDPETDITIFQEDANLEMVFKEGSVISRSGKLET